MREAVFFTVDVNREFMEEALASQMKPVQEAVATIKEEVEHRVQEVQESVIRDVHDQMNKMSAVVEQFKVNLTNDINGPKMKLLSLFLTSIMNLCCLRRCQSGNTVFHEKRYCQQSTGREISSEI